MPEHTPAVSGRTRRRPQLRRLLWVVGAMMSAACGDAPSAPVAIELGVSSRALLTGLARVRVHLHPGRIRCDVLELNGPDYDAVYFIDIDIGVADQAAGGTVFDVVEDEYSVNGWGFGMLEQPRSFGCADSPVTVRRGELAETSLVMEPFVGF